MKHSLFGQYVLLLSIVCGLAGSPRLYAYSALTHEAIIDATWDHAILPLLLAKYPGATKDQLKDAQAYAYGGCLLPDMGYYPFGCKFFTDLLHYVRTGAFVSNVLDESHDINEYAFALGVMCHYYSDKYGHHMAVNRCVPLVYPDDRKFGPEVTYEQDPLSHIRTEFGFDVLQTARGNYATEQYHKFIGFKISQPVLERAFVKTYGLKLDEVYKNFDLSVSTFRWIVKSFFPEITRAAWASRKADIKKANPTMTRRKFEYKMSRVNYKHEFGKKHEHPGVFATMLAGLIKVLPKVGPLKDLKLKVPGPTEEAIFIRSFDTVSVHYVWAVKRLSTNSASSFLDINYDTGHETTPGEYDLADKNYTILLLKLKDDHFRYVNSNLRQDLINYWNTCNERAAAIIGLDQWNKKEIALDSLRLYTPLN